MRRFPNGIEEEGFYQKEAPDYFPPWVERVWVEVREDGSRQPQVVCQNAATLVYLANQACITPHAWLSRADRLDFPDKLIFDLDPTGEDFAPLRLAALRLREELEGLGLVPFLMTTGSRGLHVVVPLDRSADFDQVRSFARRIAELVALREPRLFTVEHRKEKREDRLFLDYLRNAYGATAVAPYAVRARPGAPVAAPLEWQELEDPKLRSQRYNIKNLFRRLGRKDDPWKDIGRHARPLQEALRRLG